MGVVGVARVAEVSGLGGIGVVSEVVGVGGVGRVGGVVGFRRILMPIPWWMSERVWASWGTLRSRSRLHSFPSERSKASHNSMCSEGSDERPASGYRWTS